MSEIPKTPEKKNAAPDDARKFTLEGIDRTFLNAHSATSCIMTVDWLETGDKDEKVVRKEFDDGTVQILHIEKVMKDGERISAKHPITAEEYETYRKNAVLPTLRKKRFEFSFVQEGSAFALKYDEFKDSNLRLLEVDASSKELRDSFTAQSFPYKLAEVSDDPDFSGPSIVKVLE